MKELSFPTVAEVGLERTIYTVSEDVGVAEVCAIVTNPDLPCPIEFSFTVTLATLDGTAGRCMLILVYVIDSH